MLWLYIASSFIADMWWPRAPTLHKPRSVKQWLLTTISEWTCTCCPCTWTHMVWKTGQVKFLVLRQDRMLMGTAGRRGSSLTLNQSVIKLGSFRCSWGKVGGSSSVKICRRSDATSLKFCRRRKMILTFKPSRWKNTQDSRIIDMLLLFHTHPVHFTS